MTAVDRTEIESLVEPDRVHRRVYTDPEIFALEMERIFGRAWILVGHDSQIPQPGDWIRTSIGLRDVVTIRGADGAIRVLHNRCPHRGMTVCVPRAGGGRRLVCPYHGWAFDTAGKLLGVPQPGGYDAGFDPGEARRSMAAVARVESCRGFVFASLAAEGPTLAEYLGEISDTLHNFCDRAPDGEVEMVGAPLRQTFEGNWKLHMENSVDTVHPGFVHRSSVEAAQGFVAETGGAEDADQAIQMFNANGFALNEWDSIGIHGYDGGHVFMDGFYRGGIIDPDRRDPVFEDYKARMAAAYGEEGMKRIFGRETFNNLVYPNLSFNTRFQQLRVIRPVSVDRTDIHSYVFRLKGAPEAMFHTAVKFVSTANSPASPVLADDLAVFEQLQQGLNSEGVEWVDLSRRSGREEPFGNRGIRDCATSELPMRTMLGAWRRYMAAA